MLPTLTACCQLTTTLLLSPPNSRRYVEQRDEVENLCRGLARAAFVI